MQSSQRKRTLVERFPPTPLMSQSNICVGIRARPLLDHQRERRAPGLEIRGNRILTGTKVFDPDVVFSEEASQASIVESCLPVFESVASGRNGTIMVYGQTGTGKTHTMFGGLHDSAFSQGMPPPPPLSTTVTSTSQASVPQLSPMVSTMPTAAAASTPMAVGGSGGTAATSGIVYSAIEYLLERVRCKTRNGLAASLSVSMIEIYNEKITDMLPLSIDVPTRRGGSGAPTNGLSSPVPVLADETEVAAIEALDAFEGTEDMYAHFVDEEAEADDVGRSTSATTVSSSSSLIAMKAAEAATPTARTPTAATSSKITTQRGGGGGVQTSSNTTAYNFKEGGVLLVNGTPRNNRSIVVTSVEDAVYVVRKALARRHVSPTAMNDRSSRSHVIVMLSHDERSGAGPECVAETSHLYLIDLAGSECLKKSLATGKAAAEAGMINKSLHALRNVITALTSSQAQQGGGGGGGGNAGSLFGAPPSGRVHIPYRDSKLTELLQDSVGGTAKTMLIACISLVARDLEETKMTLEYATKARKIKNSPTADERDKFLLRIRSLEYQLQQALNKTPGSVTISREFYEDMLQLNTRLEEATDTTEKLSTMLAHAEASQRIEKYQQEENARAIRAAEEERVRCVSYLLQQVAQLDDVKAKLAASFQSMQRTMEDAQCEWHHHSDDVLRRLEAAATVGNSEWNSATTAAALDHDGVDHVDVAARRCQSSVDALVSDIIQQTKYYETCVQELARDRARGASDAIREAEGKLHEALGLLAGAHKKVQTWGCDSVALAASHTEWVEGVQQRDPVITPSCFTSAVNEVRLNAVRSVRRHMEQVSEGPPPPAPGGAMMLQPQRMQRNAGSSTITTRGSRAPSTGRPAPGQACEVELSPPFSPTQPAASTQQLQHWGASSSSLEQLPAQPSLSSAVPTTTGVGMASAVDAVRTLWAQSASLMTSWKHETLAGAPSMAAPTHMAAHPPHSSSQRFSSSQREPQTHTAPAVSMTSPLKANRFLPPAAMLHQSSSSSSAAAVSVSLQVPLPPPSTSSTPAPIKGTSSHISTRTSAPSSSLPAPGVLRASALRNSTTTSSSTVASGGGSAMANAAAAAAARKRPRSFSSSSITTSHNNAPLGPPTTSKAAGSTNSTATTNLQTQYE